MAAPPRRDNGLPAASWTPVADLDPLLADAMLEALRDIDVAAYAAPWIGVRSLTVSVVLPGRPIERLYVDSAGAQAAREVLARRVPQMRAELDAHAAAAAQDDVPVDDEVWAEIVAAYDAAPTDPVPRWPVSEDADERAADQAGDDAPAAWPDQDPAEGRRGGRLLRPALRRTPSADPAPTGPAEDPQDHYVPPEPPPLPEGDVISRLAWICVVGGPVTLLLSALLRWEWSGWTAALPLVAFVAGFVTLVARMRDRPDDEDDPDDGAVV